MEWMVKNIYFCLFLLALFANEWYLALKYAKNEHICKLLISNCLHKS